MIVTSGRAASVDQNRYERMYVFRFSFPSKVKFLFKKERKLMMVLSTRWCVVGCTVWGLLLCIFVYKYTHTQRAMATDYYYTI